VLRIVTGTPWVIAATNRGRPAGHWVVWAFASVLAVACAAPPEEGSSVEASIPTVTSERSRVEVPEPAAKAKEAPTEVARKAPPPLKLPVLKELIGRSQEQVAALFGKPSFVRNDEPARLVQYRSKKCALDIFLYREGAGYSVSYTEIRGARSVVIAESDCVRAVLNARTRAGNVR
jgi:hypothetical protein